MPISFKQSGVNWAVISSEGVLLRISQIFCLKEIYCFTKVLNLFGFFIRTEQFGVRKSKQYTQFQLCPCCIKLNFSYVGSSSVSNIKSLFLINIYFFFWHYNVFLKYQFIVSIEYINFKNIGMKNIYFSYK